MCYVFCKSTITIYIQTHVGRCGGVGRRTQVHEVVKLSCKTPRLMQPWFRRHCDPPQLAHPRSPAPAQRWLTPWWHVRPGWWPTCKECRNGRSDLHCPIEILLITLIHRLGLRSKAGREQQVHERPTQQRTPSTLRDAAIHSSFGNEQMWSQRPILRGHPPWACFHYD